MHNDKVKIQGKMTERYTLEELRNLALKDEDSGGYDIEDLRAFVIALAENVKENADAANRNIQIRKSK